MPLTLPAALDAAVKFDILRLCHLVEITRQDGKIFRFTDAASDILANGNMYRADTGFTASALLVGMNLNQMQGMTLTFGLNTPGGVTKDDLRTRRYSGAETLFYECDYSNPSDSQMLLYRGHMGRVTFTTTGQADIEILPWTDDNVQFADEVYQQTCRADLGDLECAFPIESIAIDYTVLSVDGATFTIGAMGGMANGRPEIDTFALGQLKWTSGDNDKWECDILRSDTAAKTLTLFFATPAPIKVGDTGRAYPGCDKKLSTCVNKFGNQKNMRAEPLAPQWG